MSNITKRTAIEILKVFVFSAISSTMFAFLIYKDSIMADGLLCTFLNTASLLLFLFLEYKSWSKLYETSESMSGYFVPCISALVAYIIVSVILYSIRFSLYMWTFLPTRFLEPQLPWEIAWVSVAVSYLLMAFIIFMTPIFFANKK